MGIVYLRDLLKGYIHLPQNTFIAVFHILALNQLFFSPLNIERYLMLTLLN